MYSKKNIFKKIILRFGIIYGNRKKNFSALESIFSNCIKSESITVGSKLTSRRFIHISDIVEGIVKIIKYKKNNIFNLTGTKDITLEEIVKISEKILNKKITIYENSPNLISIRKPSNKKIINEIKWKQKINLSNGLKQLNKYLSA